MSVWDELNTRHIVRICLTIAMVVGGLWLLIEIRGVLMLVGISIFLAVALGPAVDFFEHKLHIPRGGAILATYLAIVMIFAGLIALVVPPVINGANRLSRDIPNYIEDLRNNKKFREFDDKYDVTTRLQEEAEKLPNELGNAAGALQDVAAAIFNAAFQLLTVLTMTFFLLKDGKRIVGWFLRLAGRDRGPRLQMVAERIYKSTAGYVAGALTITTINGVITYIVLTILGVPFAVPLAVLMSFFGLIPLVGATIGGAIILVVTLFTDFPNATIIYAIVLILYQQFENNVLQPFVYKRTVDVPPLVVIIALLAGSALLGIAGALLAIPIAAAIQVTLREFYGHKVPPPDEDGDDDADETVVLEPPPFGPVPDPMGC